MGTIKEKLDRLQQTKDEIKAAINAKGGEIADEPFKDYPTAIGNIKVNLKYFRFAEITDDILYNDYKDFIYIDKNVPLSFMFLYTSKLYEIKDLKIKSTTSSNDYVFGESKIKVIRKQSFLFEGFCGRMFLTARDLMRIELFDILKVNSLSTAFNNCESLTFFLVKNLGFIERETDRNFRALNNWGNEDLAKTQIIPIDDGRGSLYNSNGTIKNGVKTMTNEGALQTLLETFSSNGVDGLFDRKTAGYAVCRIYLHADVKKRLGDAKIAEITALGYTIA